MKNMHKIGRLLAVCLIAVLAVVALGGCGQSEKFAGHWIGYGKTGIYGNKDMAYDITIEKNGKGYIINETDNYWDDLDTTNTFFKNSPKKVQMKWVTKKNENLVGTVKDNNLAINGSNWFFTYKENDGTLQLTLESFNMGRETIQLHKAKDGELDEFKNKGKEELLNKYKSQDYNIELQE